MAIETTTMTAVQRKLLQDSINGTEQITTGAAPIAASPELGVSLITTGGTAANETISFDLPSGPAAALGRIKRFVLIAQTGPSDGVVFDTTNMAHAGSEPLSADEFRLNHVGDEVAFELTISYPISNPEQPFYQWQPVWALSGGVRYIYAVGVRVGKGSANGDVLEIRGSDGPSGNGSVSLIAGTIGGLTPAVILLATTQNNTVIIDPGTGATDGGDFLVELPSSPGGGRDGQFRVGLPTIDPHVFNAFWCDPDDGFRVKVSQG